MKTDVKTEGKVDADSSIDDVLKEAAKVPDDAEAEGAEESAANKQETEDSETTEKVEKPDEDKVSDEEVDAGLEEGQPIPYDRFKKVNEERKALKNRIKEFEEGQDEDTELNAILKDPEVAALILKKQGYTDQAIAEKFKEAGIEIKKGNEKEPTFDMTTVDGWDKKIAHSINKALDARLGPVEKSLTEAQQKEQIKAFGERMDKERQEAEKLAKDTYGIEYGDEKDAKDTTTAAGKMMAYLQKHPEKIQAAAHGILSKSDLLRLALAEEGVKLGEKKGELKEKKRVEKVKTAAMEGEETITTDKAPDQEASVDEILAYKNKHPNWTP